MKVKFLIQFNSYYKTKEYDKALKIAYSYYLKNPYSLFIYHILFTIFTKKKKYHKLIQLLLEAQILLPDIFYIKELLFYTLSHKFYISKVTGEFILETVIPLIKEGKASPFMLYCLSTYNAKRGFLESSFFYSSLIFKINKQTLKNSLWTTHHLLILKRMQNDLLMKEFIEEIHHFSSINNNHHLKSFYQEVILQVPAFRQESPKENILILLLWMYETKLKYQKKDSNLKKVTSRKIKLKWILWIVSTITVIISSFLSFIAS